MQQDVRNGVTPSVGLVVTSEFSYVSRLSSIPRSVEACSFCPFISPSVGSPKRCFLFHLFYCLYFDSEKHVTRTSKTPYSWRAVNSFQAIVPYMGQEKESFFTGVYLPQKSVLLPPIERQYKPFQKHVSSY
jgi:hypothetical protein